MSVYSLCLESHMEPEQGGLNYPWLDHIHGGLDYIRYEEPPLSGSLQDYTEDTWKAHCSQVDHHPSRLVYSHYNAFINPETRFARLFFYFKDGTVMEPITQFYQLEAQWMQDNMEFTGKKSGGCGCGK